MDGGSKKRLIKLTATVISALAAGEGYLIFIRVTKSGIPCIFRTFWDIFCPGCGVSRMFVSLSQLDILAAFGYNPFIFCLLPIGITLGVRYSVSYVKSGRRHLDKLETAALVIVLILAVIFGVLRNIPGLEFLAPMADVYF